MDSFEKLSKHLGDLTSHLNEALKEYKDALEKVYIHSKKQKDRIKELEDELRRKN